MTSLRAQARRTRLTLKRIHSAHRRKQSCRHKYPRHRILARHLRWIEITLRLLRSRCSRSNHHLSTTKCPSLKGNSCPQAQVKKRPRESLVVSPKSESHWASTRRCSQRHHPWWYSHWLTHWRKATCSSREWKTEKVLRKYQQRSLIQWQGPIDRYLSAKTKNSRTSRQALVTQMTSTTQIRCDWTWEASTMSSLRISCPPYL